MRALVALFAAIALPAGAQAPCTADAMVVFDGSASMADIGPEAGAPPRIEDARRAMRTVLPRVETQRRIGLVTYGPGPEGSCDSLNLRFPPVPAASAPILEVLDRLDPIGLTPLAAAVEMAAEALAYRSRPAVVVLVTDGNDTCGGAPCALAERLSGEAADLTVHVLGFRVVGDITAGYSAAVRPFPRGEVEARCLAERTGGLYALPETTEDLVAALEAALGCAVIGRAPRPQAARPS